MTSIPLHEALADDLSDPEFAAGYLEGCLEDGPEVFLVALRDVVKANGGMSALAKEVAASRPSLYQTLSSQGNPEFRTLQAVLESVGLSGK
jgi:probable addiction module antidote protein